MINTHYIELPLSRTNFHGPKGVRAIEVLLYIVCIIYSIFYVKARLLKDKLFVCVFYGSLGSNGLIQ